MNWRVVLTISACVWAIGSIALWRWPAADSGPPLVVISPGPNIPEVGWGEHRLTVSLENRSGFVLHLIDVKPGCDCTSVTVSRREVFPGRSVDLICEWDTTGLNGQAATELTLLYKNKFADTAKVEKARVLLEAQVTPAVVFSPDSLRFLADRDAVGSIEVIPNTDSSVRVVTAEATHPALTAEVVEDGRRVSVQFLTNQWPDGPRREQIRFLLRGKSEYHIPFSVTVVPGPGDGRSGEMEDEAMVTAATARGR